MRLNKQNKIIVGVLAFLLTLTVGYAVFSQSMNITGTAEASGNFSLIFEKDTKNSPTCDGYSNDCNIDLLSSISDDKKTLTITVDKLTYPSAYVRLPVKIINNGTVKAILKEIVITDKDGNAYNDKDIKITYSNIKINDIFEPNEEKDVAITVTWDKDSTNTEVTLVKFNISLKYEQATSIADSGGGGTSSESDWTFETNNTGVITAYNYEKGTDVVVPAYVDGIAVTTINSFSFLSGNLTAYQDEDAELIYMIIDEDETNWSNVKDKIIEYFSSNSCDEGDTECLEQIKQMMYFCTDKSVCYNASDESVVTSIPDHLEIAGVLNVNPNSDVSLEESFDEPKANISTLDLSQATNLTAIEASSFEDAGLQSVNFGENSNLKTIGASAFYGNEISELIIPESVEEIGNSAFSSNNITSVTFKQNDNTLANNSNIKASYLSDSTNNKTSKLVENSTGLKTIGNSAFSSNQISSIKLPDTITSIGSYAFYQNQLTSITIPNNVITIGEYAFYENQIDKLTLNENSVLEIIGNYAFQNNQISGELTIPSSVTSIGASAFQNNQISNLTIPKSASFYRNSFMKNPIEILSIGTCTKSICAADSNAMSSAEEILASMPFGNQIRTLTIESGEIGDGAFANYSGLNEEWPALKIQNLTLGKGVTSIEDYAFFSNQISSLALPNSVTSIGMNAFQNNLISELVIPSSVTSMKQAAFYSNQISSLTFEENSSLKTIGTQAFQSNQISKIEIPSSVTEIGASAFYENQISGELVIPNGVTAINSSAFSSNQISSLVISKSVTSIGRSAFYNNPLTSILIKRTKEDFTANVTAKSWYSGSPTITYQEEE